MPLLIEFGNWKSIKNKDALKQMLRDIWQQRLFVPDDMQPEEADNHYQPFLSFDDHQVRANNFVGFIQNDDEVIEIYPKVFRNVQSPDKALMLRHIFYWFNYCRKWKFPFNKASLDTIDIAEFPELIINLIASQFLESVSKQPLTMYQPVEEAMQTPRGTINFKRYLNKSLAYGNLHRIECDYEPFLFDNKVNRIIKYCSRLLISQTKFSENLRILQDVIFILDEVDDVPCTVHDVDKVSLNSFFEDYNLIMHSSRLILNQQLYSDNTYDLSQWCLLFPMEYIFEDFLAGFLETHFSDQWKVEYQKSEKNLSDIPPAFRMQHDIFLTNLKTQKTIIVDAKYKVRDADYKNDPKKGVSQADLYQMVSYGFKRGCIDIILVYPNISEILNKPDRFEIISPFTDTPKEGEIVKAKINITAVEIPFWSLDNFSSEEVDKRLIKEFKEILMCY